MIPQLACKSEAKLSFLRDKSLNSVICTIVRNMLLQSMSASKVAHYQGWSFHPIISYFAEIKEAVFNRFIAWKLRNKYDKDGQMIEPRPKEDDVHEERFLAWVS